MAYLHKEPIETSAATLKSLYVRDPEKGRQQIGELLDLMMEPSHQSLVERFDLPHEGYLNVLESISS